MLGFTDLLTAAPSRQHAKSSLCFSGWCHAEASPTSDVAMAVGSPHFALPA
jgi:hypothetical protein